MFAALTAAVLAVTVPAPPAGAADAAKVLERIEATRPSWLPSLDKCPADVMPVRETKLSYSKGRCERTLDQCLDNCRTGDASDCYAAALVLQSVKGSSWVPEALFLKACSMGIASGCTNRAAGMAEGDGIPCAIRSFAGACDRADPWACTMLGAHLVRGIGIAKDHERARRVLARSCRFGEMDEPCRAASRLMKEIGE